jgi:type VII secretion integral membrane protein EccD
MEERTQHRTATPVRLRFVLDRRSAEVAIPGDTALVDVLPAVLPALDPDAADNGVGHDGWVAQRLGQPPLDEERSANDLHLLDGETLYLRPRAAQLPAISFDDLVDGIAEQVREHSGRWSPRRSRFMLLTLAGVLLLAGLPVLALGGAPGVRAAIAACLTVALLAGAGLASRAAADPLSGALLAGAAVAYAALAGWYGGAAAAPLAPWSVRVACLVLAVLATLCVGLAAVADAALLFTATLALTLLIGVPAVLAAVGGLPPQQAAGVGLCVTLIAGMFLPATAFRLSGLKLPMLPGKPEELGEEIDPVPHELVVERGAVAVGYLSALCIGTGAAQLLLGWALIQPGGTWPMVLAGLVGAALFLRARHLTNAVQRWALLVPATVLVLGDVLRWCVDRALFTRAVAVVPMLVLLGVALVVAAATLPGQRLRPYWGRAVELSESIVAIAILPVLGAVLGVYAAVRAWFGG